MPPVEEPIEPTTSALPTQEKDIENADDDVDDADEPTFVPVFADKHPHAFFPMQFGNMRGGSVAVANAFSTGKGSAASHAVAYGSSRHH